MTQRTGAIVELNVGGKHFATLASTLSKYPDSNLAKLVSSNDSFIKDASGRIFIDRDGDMFKYVLDYLRDDRLHVNFQADRERLKVEAIYFGLTELQKLLDAQPRRYNNNMSQSSIGSDRQRTCITLGYRGTFAFGKDGLIDVKFRKLSRLLVAGKLSVCREVFMDTLNESRDPDHGDAESRYSSRLYLKHSCLEQAFDMLYENGFRLVTSCGTSTSAITSESLKPGVDPEESKWQHYNEFVFVRE